jgi:hypothetical protein
MLITRTHTKLPRPPETTAVDQESGEASAMVNLFYFLLGLCYLRLVGRKQTGHPTSPATTYMNDHPFILNLDPLVFSRLIRMYQYCRRHTFMAKSLFTATCREKGAIYGMRSYILYFVFFYSCFSHLEHRASVKSFVSLLFLNLRRSVGLLGRGISSSHGRYLTHRIKTKRHLCLEWDSNPQSQCSSGRRHFMPWTVRPP